MQIRTSLSQMRSRDEGSGLVELALTLPMFFALLIGTVEYGRLAYASIEVNGAARAAASYGGQSTTTAADTAGMKTAASNASPDLANMTNGLTTTPAMSCTCSDGTTVTCANVATNCKSPAHAVDYVQINTSAVMDPLFHVPGLPTSYTLKGQAFMQVSQ